VVRAVFSAFEILELSVLLLRPEPNGGFKRDIKRKGGPSSKNKQVFRDDLICQS
jgi:hypothetical protein